jgi:hypothetical protein
LSLIVAVCVAVHLDYQPGAQAEEVRDVLTQRVLPSEFESADGFPPKD